MAQCLHWASVSGASESGILAHTVSCKHWPIGGKLGNGGEMKWAQRSSGGFLSLTQDHHRDMEGHQQGDGQAAWPVVKGPRWGFLTLLR